MSAVNAVALLAAAGGDYQISRSVRLRSSASAYLNKSIAAPTNSRKWTYSGWVKRGVLGVNQIIISGGATPLVSWFRFNTSNQLDFVEYDSATFQANLQTTAVFRDVSAWYHIEAAYDSTQATAANRFIVYVNGVQQAMTGTTVASNWQSYINLNYGSNSLFIGREARTAVDFFDGYLTEVNFIDGQALTPSSFGETDAVTGVWKPKKYAGTYGTNGFYLNFSDNSAATAAAIGKDNSGNGNNWTPNNISVTAGVTYDSMVDVPTMWADGGNGRGNYATLNPVDNTGITLQSGNLYFYTSTGNTLATSTQNFPTSGKYYFEFTNLATNGSDQRGAIAIVPSGVGRIQGDVFAISNRLVVATGQYSGLSGAGIFASPSGTISVAQNDIIGVAIDADTNKIWIANNNAWLNSGNPSAGTGQVVTASSSMAGNYTVAVASGANASGYVGTGWINFGQRPFAYTPPTGFKALNTQNLPEPTIKKGNQYFDATTYTGNASTNNIVNSGAMQPDLVWIKNRGGAFAHYLTDAVRGAYKVLYSNLTNAEYNGTSNSDSVSSFNSNGFTVLGGTNRDNYNQSSNNYVAWQWKESVTAGFDIVTHTGTGGGSVRTIAHSLGVVPSMIVTKCRGTAVFGTDGWVVYFKGFAVNDYIFLNTTGAKGSSANYLPALPTSSVFSVGGTSANVSNESGLNYVSYLFAEVAGYSKFGSYTGNGSADGPFVYCGFRPKFVMVKGTSGATNWFIWDSSRDAYNVANKYLLPNSSSAEDTTSGEFDILSNGFKFRANNQANSSGGTYIFAAFAENPFKNSLAR